MQKFKHFEDVFWGNVRMKKTHHPVYGEIIQIAKLEEIFNNAVELTKKEAKKQEADDAYFKVDKNGVTVKGNITPDNDLHVAFEKLFGE